MTISKHPNRKVYNWLIYDRLDTFLQRYAFQFKGTLYDLGCGASPYRNFFLSCADKYVGVDWAGSLHVTAADISADLNKPLPIESGVADSVVSISVIEHLYEPQVMINEAFRILKPGGTLLLQVPWQWWIHEAPHDYFRYTPYALRYMLNKAGFVDVAVEAQSGFFTTWIIKFNYFTNRIIRGPKYFRRFVKGVCVPFWYVGQKLAPYLDRLDNDWELDAQAYCVLAKKDGKDDSAAWIS